MYRSGKLFLDGQNETVPNLTENHYSIKGLRMLESHFIGSELKKNQELNVHNCDSHYQGTRVNSWWGQVMNEVPVHPVHYNLLS